MEPEQRFSDHVDGGEEVVAATHMAQLMRQHGFELRRRQAFGDAGGQEQDGAPPSHCARFEQARGTADFHG
jgi:hypothetical protein